MAILESSLCRVLLEKAIDTTIKTGLSIDDACFLTAKICEKNKQKEFPLLLDALKNYSTKDKTLEVARVSMINAFEKL